MQLCFIWNFDIKKIEESWELYFLYSHIYQAFISVYCRSIWLYFADISSLNLSLTFETMYVDLTVERTSDNKGIIEDRIK